VIGHWRVYKKHPGKLGGSGKPQDKERISFLIKPDDRGKFIRWGERRPNRKEKSDRYVQRI
jgi:hypothetical protein